MSLKQIATKVGVSVSTVSRVLSGKESSAASPAVKEAIFKAARELQYTPNIAARKLQSSSALAAPHALFIVLAGAGKNQNNHFFRTLSHAVASEVSLRGHVVVDETNETDAILHPRKAKGVIVLGKCNVERLDKLYSIYNNIVCVGLNPFVTKYDQVVCDGKNAAMMAMEHLIDKGHQKIGYVGEFLEENRYLGYCEAIRKANLCFTDSFVLTTSQTESGGRRAALKYLKLAEKPTALFCANDVTAIGFIRTLMSSETEKLPELVSVDDIRPSRTIKPTLTTVHIPIEEMGRIAVGCLMDRIEGKRKEVIHIRFPCRMVYRQSS